MDVPIFLQRDRAAPSLARSSYYDFPLPQPGRLAWKEMLDQMRAPRSLDPVEAYYQRQRENKARRDAMRKGRSGKCRNADAARLRMKKRRKLTAKWSRK